MARQLYEKIHDEWKNQPDKTTPVLAEDLEHIEQGIYDNSNNSALKEIYGDNSLSMGRKANSDNGINSLAYGTQVIASGKDSQSLGQNTTASGQASHAEGTNSQATAVGSHAEGYNTKAIGIFSHSEGYSTTSNSQGAHSEGQNTTASGQASHAEGIGTEASGFSSHAEGYFTKSNSQYQHVQGKYNEEDTEGIYAHIVGGGSSNEDRKNIHTLDWQGNAVYAGDVTNGQGVSLNGLKEMIDNIMAIIQPNQEDT